MHTGVRQVQYIYSYISSRSDVLRLPLDHLHSVHAHAAIKEQCCSVSATVTMCDTIHPQIIEVCPFINDGPLS